MKTFLRFSIALLIAVLAHGFSFAQTLTTNLGSLPNVKTGIARDFTVTTQGGSGQVVSGVIDFTPFQAEDIVLLYRAPGAETYTTLAFNAKGTAAFGPEEGLSLPAEATVHNFRILFRTVRDYDYTLRLQTVETTPQPVVTATGNVAVTEPINFPTIDGTLDIVDEQKGVVVNQAEDWQILLEANEFVWVRGNIQIVLDNPAQKDNITLQYNTNREATTPEEVNFQPLQFNEQGIATIGPAEGEELTEAGINQLMRITFTESGSYTYTLRFLRDDGNALTEVKETITVASVAGIDDMIGDTRISVYPTLADKGSVRIELGNIRNASISVTDMLGRTVMQLENASGSVNLKTSDMAKGTYFVKIIKGNDVAGSRFIVR